MSKWQKISPAEIKVGDRVRVKHVSDDYEETTSADVKHVTDLEIGIGPYTLHKNEGTWYIRKPKKAKPEPDLVEGHDAKFWFGRWEKQLNHSEQLQAVNSGRRVKMQRLEKEVKDACKETQYWQNKYAVLAASANDLPEKPKPLTRPDEPPVGSFFRVDRTGREFYRYPQVSLTHYFHLACDAGDRPWVAWADVTIPGDTITLLYLREVPND